MQFPENKALVDEGHKTLLSDIEELRQMVASGIYHDFASEIPAPKQQLAALFHHLRQNVIDGRYDN